MLALDLQQIISQAISFLILLWVLKRFAWKPLLSVLDKRKEHIKEELRKAEEKQADLLKQQEELSKRLAVIDNEARAKLQETIKEGKRIAVEMQEDARAQSQKIITKAKETVHLELAKAKVGLRDHVASMTLDAIEQVLEIKLDEKADKKIVDSVLDDIEKVYSRK